MTAHSLPMRTSPPPYTFLSYASANLAEANRLDYGLSSHGVRLWRDLRGLPSGPQLEGFEEAILLARGYVIMATPEAAQSEVITKKELPAAYKKERSHTGYFILPAFYMRPTEASKAFRGVIDVPLGNYAGAIISQSDHGRGIQKLARMALDRLYPTLDQPVSLCLSSYFRPVADIPLDFTHLWKQRRLSKITAQSVLASSRDIHRWLLERGVRTVSLSLRAHLPVALAFGLGFPDTGGLRVVVDDGASGWSSSTPAAVSFYKDCQEGRLGSHAIAVRISFSQDVVPASRAFLDTLDMRPRAILTYSSRTAPGSSAIKSPREGARIVRSIVEDIKRKARSFSAHEIHLFISCPSPMAFLLGSQMNAVGDVFLYDFDESRGVYYPCGNTGAASRI